MINMVTFSLLLLFTAFLSIIAGILTGWMFGEKLDRYFEYLDDPDEIDETREIV